MKRVLVLLATFAAVWFGHRLDAADTEAPAAPQAVASNPYLFLIRDAAVHRELRLTDSQIAAIRRLTDEIDPALWSTRNKSLEEGSKQLGQLIETAEDRMKEILPPAKRERLVQIRLQVQGVKALLDPAVFSQLSLDDESRKQIRTLIDDTEKELAEFQKKLNAGEDSAAVNKQAAAARKELQKQAVAKLSRTQRSRWESMLGPPIDTSKIGSGLSFKPPHIHDSGEWINSRPLDIAGLQGQVVAVHFYAFGCINCRRNFPWYREWQDEFGTKGLTIIGIHTPETSAEQDSENVRRKAGEDSLEFPIVIDNAKQNWNAWGNSMWPSVYLIDKKGYVRYWWYGEMDWLGNGGHKTMKKHIQDLLAEKE